MDNKERFQSYGDVNREIQSLIASKEANPPKKTTNNAFENTDILTLLESLNRTYNEINAALQTENSQALKDVILKSDIKMSMVCETLLETLKKTTEEKNNLIKENQQLEKSRREAEANNLSNKIVIDKLKSELEFKLNNIDELNRIVRDQKDRVTEAKEDSLRAKNEVMLYKAKMEELENLRGRANDRMMVYEKELEGLNTIIIDKDKRISTLAIEKKREEEKNASIKVRITELESLSNALNKKIEVKDKNMVLCNSELSKLLCENKRLRIEHEKFKESSGYYEGLYNNLSTQNAYLNSQLNKMLKMNDYSSDIDGFISKYKKKLKKKKKALKTLESENRKLREQLEEQNIEVPDTTSDSLIKKIEDLNTKNEKYRKQINELEKERQILESKSKTANGEHPFKEKVKNVLNRNIEEPRSFPAQYGYKKPPITNYPQSILDKGTHIINEPTSYSLSRVKTGNDQGYNINNEYQSIKHNIDYKSGNSKYDYMPNTYMPDYQSASKLQNGLTGYTDNRYTDAPRAEEKEQQNSTYLKMFNLENDYEEKANKKVQSEFVGGFINDSSIKPPQLDINYMVDTNAPADTKNSIFTTAPVVHDSVQLNGFGKKIDEDFKNCEDASVESVKTYHTSSTLKEMMARTDNLQKKFQDLEEKLAQIKEGESIDKLTDKIKAYNSYYSDWNAESNESDYI
ncbi:hypothetical protein GINT2_000668 [Glugoides intestinalis]